MDNFKEEIIVRKGGQGFKTLMFVLTYLFIVLFGILGFVGLSGVMGMNFTVSNFVLLIIGFGIVWFLWRNKDNFNTEYEYTFTGGEMDFAKVMGGRRRRNLLNLRLADAEVMGMVESDDYKRYSSMPGVKSIDFTLNHDSKKQFIYFIKEGNKFIMILECSDGMWDMMVKSVPRFNNPHAVRR